MAFRFLLLYVVVSFLTVRAQDKSWLMVDSVGQIYSREFSMMAFHNDYYQGRRGALEFVLHGDRIASNGDLRLNPVPIPDGAFNPFPTIIDRTHNTDENTVTVNLKNEPLQLGYTIHSSAIANGIRVKVTLDKPLPDSLLGRLGFILEIFPGHYKGKSFFMDGKPGLFPYQFNGTRRMGNSGLEGVAMASGKKLSMAPEDSLHHFVVESREGVLELIDGRASTNHKWFILRQRFVRGQTEVEWTFIPAINKNWREAPVIGFSQIGYHTRQRKVSVIELDPMDEYSEATLYKIGPDGSRTIVLRALPKPWGKYYRKNFVQFDFSHITDEGLYALGYQNLMTEAFAIRADLFHSDFWRPTLETFIPAQMCHMSVWDRMRWWHGLCHMDDALQAPPGIEHFDHYHMGDTTFTRFRANEHIPGLNQGGWHDAGDNDIESPSNSSTLHTLSLAYEEFGLASDQTYINHAENAVRLHEPDGVPDLLQQIVHGAKYILANYDAFGHYSRGVVEPDFEQYLQMGDASWQTDGLVYSPDLLPHQRTATHSGKRDDRWVFTNYTFSYEADAAEALAAATRALAGYDTALSAKCLRTALTVWHDISKNFKSEADEHPRYRGYREVLKKQVAAELFLCTRSEVFRNELRQIPEVTGRLTGYYLAAMSRVVDHLSDKALKDRLRKMATEFQAQQDAVLAQHPYSVPPIHTMFGTGFSYMSVASTQYYLHKAFPDIVSTSIIDHVLAYMHGNHPVCNHSLVNGVGAKSITSAYGFNRADFSYIPGGICAGPLLIEPDFIEFQIDDPFFWVQKEYTIASGATYVFMMLAAEHLFAE